MKLFAINETEWIAANTEEDALEYEGIEREEARSIEEIPESAWDDEIECVDVWNEDSEDENGDPILIKMTIRDIMKVAIESGEVTKIMTEGD